MMKSIVTALKFLVFSFLVAAFSTFSSIAQTINKAKIDSLLSAVASDDQAMGSLAISRNGSMVYQRAIGSASVNGAQRLAANTKTHYRIGSISKLFTAVMVFQLIEENKLKLDTKLSAFYPELPNADTITVSHLLAHRSGLFNFVRDTAYQNYMGTPHTASQMLEKFVHQPSDFVPGTKAEYSNTNFVLLGYIIEKITHKTYAEALKLQITRKLSLTDTYFGGKINSLKNEASSYYHKNGWEEMPETDMSIPGGAGAIVSTPTDLVKFIDALFNGKLINAVHLNLMKTVHDGFGMGMFQMPFGPKMAFGHHGDIDGFSSVLGYFPEEKVAYAYSSNGIDYSIKELINGVLRIYYNIPYTIPSFKTPVVSSTDLDKYVGNYSSLRIPPKIRVWKDGNTLMAQVTGQPEFALKPLDKDKFGYALAGIILEFRPVFGEFSLKQGGLVFPFTIDEED